MNPHRIRRGALAALAGLAMTASSVAATGPDAFAATGHPPATAGFRDACPAQPGPVARCLTRYRLASTVAGLTAAAKLADVAGWGATDIASAYRLPAGVATTGVVGVSIAFHAPNLEQDLNTYRAQYGLAPCTVVSGCLRVVNQDGAASPRPALVNLGWQVEETLDVSMVSAACPSCRILVVEGNTNSYDDLAATEDTAVALGAQVVSNSYGGRENGMAMRYASHYQHPGHTIVASSGDAGFTAASFPAVFNNVTAVGGTTLDRAANARGWTESVWSLAGSGCSAYVAKPAWQHDSHCPMKTIADVAAVADNIALFNSMIGGWLTVSGTGAKCGGDYLCTGQPGYDAPTGLDTPNGIGAFVS